MNKEIDITSLPSEPITTPLAPLNPNINSRPHLVNLGRFQPIHPRSHKDPLVRIDFARPTERLPLSFFARKALDIIRTHLDAEKIARDPKASTILTAKEIDQILRSSNKARGVGKKEKSGGGSVVSDQFSHPLKRLRKRLPQYPIPDVVLAELCRSGIYDHKQPIHYDLEMGKDATEFRVATLRAEDPLRTAIATRFLRTSSRWSELGHTTYISQSEQVNRVKKLLIAEGDEDTISKIEMEKEKKERSRVRDPEAEAQKWKELKELAKEKREVLKLKKELAKGTAAKQVLLSTSQFVSDDEPMESDAGESEAGLDFLTSEELSSENLDDNSSFFDEFGNRV